MKATRAFDRLYIAATISRPGSILRLVPSVRWTQRRYQQRCIEVVVASGRNATRSPPLSGAADSHGTGPDAVAGFVRQLPLIQEVGGIGLVTHVGGRSPSR